MHGKMDSLQVVFNTRSNKLSRWRSMADNRKWGLGLSKAAKTPRLRSDPAIRIMRKREEDETVPWGMLLVWEEGVGNEE